MQVQKKKKISGVCSIEKILFQKSVVEAVMDATRDRPWLWAVIILVVILPLVLIIAYCCMPSSTPPKVGLCVLLFIVTIKFVVFVWCRLWGFYNGC